MCCAFECIASLFETNSTNDHGFMERTRYFLIFLWFYFLFICPKSIYALHLTNRHKIETISIRANPSKLDKFFTRFIRMHWNSLVRSVEILHSWLFAISMKFFNCLFAFQVISLDLPHKYYRCAVVLLNFILILITGTVCSLLKLKSTESGASSGVSLIISTVCFITHKSPSL